MKKAKFIRKIPDGKGGFRYIYKENDQKTKGHKQIDYNASGENIEWHITDSKNVKNILESGFLKTSKEGIGVGGSSTSGNTFTFKDKENAVKIISAMSKIEKVRTSKNPIEEAANITGQNKEFIEEQGNFLEKMWDQYVKNEVGGRNITDKDKAVYVTTSIIADYIPFKSFLHSKEKRNFSLLPVDTLGGKIISDTDNESSWEPGSVKIKTK